MQLAMLARPEGVSILHGIGVYHARGLLTTLFMVQCLAPEAHDVALSAYLYQPSFQFCIIDQHDCSQIDH